MRFKMSKNAQNFFSNIIKPEGSHAAKDPKKFDHQFDVYYCCALIGLAAIKRDNDTSQLKDLTENYPKPYADYKAYIAGLLIATEAKRQGISLQSNRLEEIMLDYLSHDDTMLSEEGIKALNAYSLKGYSLINEYPLTSKPESKEDFLDAFRLAIERYSTKDN